MEEKGASTVLGKPRGIQGVITSRYESGTTRVAAAHRRVQNREDPSIVFAPRPTGVHTGWQQFWLR